MPNNIEQMELMLQKLQQTFLNELPERCDRIESGILALGKAPLNQEQFNELYRNVHSLKGSGGTYGLGIITTICHQLENFITESAGRFDDTFVSHALAYNDLVRKVAASAQQKKPDYAPLEVELETIQAQRLQTRRAVLVADPSLLMMKLYQKALIKLPLQLAFVGDGLIALERLMRERFDFMIIARELKNLNGVAVTAALRLSGSRNQNIPIIMVTSGDMAAPPECRIEHLIRRDHQLAEKIVGTCLKAMGLSI